MAIFPPLSGFDYLIVIIISIIFMIGIYQFYLWTGKHFFYTPRNLSTKFDHWFPYRPVWGWVYICLYPVIAVSVFTASNMRQFMYALFSYFILIMILLIFYLFFPVKVPPEWHRYRAGNTLSEKMMRILRKFDAPTNCFPSAHVASATLTAFHVMANVPVWGYWPFLFPLLISLSVLYTKQHYFADIFPAALLGWFTFFFYTHIY